MFSSVHLIEEDDQRKARTSYYLSGQGYSPISYANVAEFLAGARSPTGCVLLAADLHTVDLAEQVAEIRSSAPTLPIVIQSHSTPAVAAVSAVKAGAVDCVEAPAGPDLLVALERALRVEQCDSMQTRYAAACRLDQLSQRERQVLQGLVGGMTNKEIARRLGISPRTVEMHRAHMLSQLELTASSAALKLAITAGLPPLVDAHPVSAVALDPERAPRRAARTRRTAEAALDAVLPSVVDVLEGTTDCVFLLDREDRLTYLNRAAIETIARDRDLAGMNLWDAFPEARNTIAFTNMQEAARERKPVRFEFYEPDLAMWFDVSVRPIPSGLQVFFRDLTRKREALVALRRSEERLRLALDASGDGAWDWDIATGHIEMSQRFLHALGYAQGSAQPDLDWVKSRIHPEDLPLVEHRLEEHLQGRTPSFHAEYRLLDGRSEWRWLLDRGRVVDQDPETGEPRRMVGTGTDITELKHQQLQAEEALERLELARAGAGAGLWDLNLAERTVRLCDRSLAMLGIDAAPFVPLPERAWEDSVHPEDLPATKRALEEALATGAIFRASYRARTGSEERWILSLGRALPGSCGAPPRVVGLNLQLSSAL